MALAPLVPVRFWISDVSIRANPGFQAIPGRVLIPLVQLHVKLERAENSAQFRCQVSIQAPSNDRADAANQGTAVSLQFPYAIEMQVSGLFAFDEATEIDPDRMPRMVAFNGLSMLWGFARDIVLQMTALGQHGPFMLPAVNLTETAESLMRQASRERGV